MSTRIRKTRKSRKTGSADSLHKPRGVIQSRVQKVGPEHFAIISVDCAKLRSKWMLADFYGNIAIAPTVVAHNRVELDAAVQHIRQAMTEHDFGDGIVAVERTGRYHHVIRDTFRRADFDTRIVHPHTTKQFRQPDDPNIKTDDTDLKAIHRSAVNGFALSENTLDDSWRSLQLLVRHRRDLVEKNAAVHCQIREHLDAALPGYAGCFDKLWHSGVALPVVRQFPSPDAIRAAGRDGLSTFLRQKSIRFQRRTLDAVVQWAEHAATPEQSADIHHRIAMTLDDERQHRLKDIRTLEREMAARLVQTPYILLLSFPGINVISAADFAGEMGPITHYANARTITGRAGLFPARYQSDHVDRQGRLVRRGNRRLRAAILRIADNLILCNRHFRTLAAAWKLDGKDPRYSHVKVGMRFCRIAYQIVAGRQVFRHPAMRERSYILDKLLAFHNEHETPLQETLQQMHHAAAQIPKKEYAAEAGPLKERLQTIQRKTKKGPQPLADAIAIVLARLGVGEVQSTASEERDCR